MVSVRELNPALMLAHDALVRQHRLSLTNTDINLVDGNFEDAARSRSLPPVTLMYVLLLVQGFTAVPCDSY
jgi:hypothetical protein